MELGQNLTRNVLAISSVWTMESLFCCEHYVLKQALISSHCQLKNQNMFFQKNKYIQTQTVTQVPRGKRTKRVGQH